MRGCGNTDPALSDLRSDHSVRAPYAPRAIALPASPPIPSHNILHARAIRLSAVPEVEALPGRSEQKILVQAVPAPGHGLAAHNRALAIKSAVKAPSAVFMAAPFEFSPVLTEQRLRSFDPYPPPVEIVGLLVLAPPLHRHDGWSPAPQPWHLTQLHHISPCFTLTEAEFSRGRSCGNHLAPPTCKRPPPTQPRKPAVSVKYV